MRTIILALGCVVVGACGPEDHVRFGEPNILTVDDDGGGCGECPLPQSTGASCPTWRDAVYAVFESSCDGAGCHDPALPAATEPLIPKGDAGAAYANLGQWTRNGAPYISPDATDAYILCNADARDTDCFGPQMPIGGFADLDLVRAWVLCGMPDEVAQ